MAAPAAIAAGAGLLGGAKNNKGQQRAANSANGLAMRQIAMQEGLFNTIMDLARRNSPNLSADTQIGNLAKDASYWNGKQLHGTAAAMRTAGYQPGDSEINTRLDAVSQKNQMGFAQLANQIRVNAPMQQAGLFAMANPSSLNAGIGYAQGQQQMHYGMMQNPSGFLGAVAPFLDPRMYQGGMQTQTAGLAKVGAGAIGRGLGSIPWHF